MRGDDRTRLQPFRMSSTEEHVDHVSFFRCDERFTDVLHESFTLSKRVGRRHRFVDHRSDLRVWIG